MRILIIIFCTPLFLVAQTDEVFHSIEWNTNLLFESNSLDKGFLNTMLYGGYINDSTKKNWISSVGDENVFYSEISNEISYTFERNSYVFGFRFADRNILNTSFSDDLLRIVFEGNFHHQDKTLEFGGTNIRIDRFQQYTLSYGLNFNKLNISTSFSYLSGNHHISYIIEKGSLYTAPFGNLLDVSYDMSAFVTDTASLNPFENNGNGLSLDLSIEFKIKQYDIHLSFSDLGFIMWDPSSITLVTDSNFTFSGIEIEDIYSFNDSLININNSREKLPYAQKRNFKSYIPSIFHFKVSGISDYKYLKNYSLGVRGKWQPFLDDKPISLAKINQGFTESNFKTLYYIQSVFNAKYCDVIPTINYGGYSSDTNFGLALSKGIKHNLTIGTHHLEDVLKSSSSKAVSVYFNIKLQF